MAAEKKGIVNVGRRTWDREEYAEKAKLREQGLLPESSLRTAVPAKAVVVANVKREHGERDYTLQLSARVGKTSIVQSNAPLETQAGFYCDLCKVSLRDNHSFIDHINGRKHHMNMGLAMKPEKSRLDDVRQRLAAGLSSQDQSIPAVSQKSQKEKIEDLDARIDKLREEEERRRQEKKEKKRRQREEEENAEGEVDPALEMMGMPMGFGGSRKK